MTDTPMTDKPYRHLPGKTAAEQLAHNLVVAKGSSPFYPDEPKAPPIDTSVTATCTCCSPPRRFVGTAGKTAEEWLARHAEGLTGRKATANARRRLTYAEQKATEPD
jgi:hypothetical protein